MVSMEFQAKAETTKNTIDDNLTVGRLFAAANLRVTQLGLPLSSSNNRDMREKLKGMRRLFGRRSATLIGRIIKRQVEGIKIPQCTTLH